MILKYQALLNGGVIQLFPRGEENPIRISVQPSNALFRDFFNPKSISGTVKTKGSLTGDCIASLYEESTELKVMETITSELGQYFFNGLSDQSKYFVLMKNKNDSWEYRISSRRVPK